MAILVKNIVPFLSEALIISSFSYEIRKINSKSFVNIFRIFKQKNYIEVILGSGCRYLTPTENIRVLRLNLGQISTDYDSII